MQHNKNKFLIIFAAALALVAMVVSAQAATWDNTQVYNGTVLSYKLAVGDKLKSASDDTVRIFTAQYNSPWNLLLFTDRSTSAPMNWSTDIVGTDSVSIRDAVAIGDVNGDGINDLVYGRYSSPYRVKRIYWTGSAWATQELATFTSTIYGITVGDADNDGVNEIYVAAGSNVQMIKWNGSAWVITQIYTGSSSMYGGVAIGDFDAAYSGNELALSDYYAHVVEVRWTGSAWTSNILYSNGSMGFYSTAVGDFDASNPGAEIALWNGYGTYGAYELYGSGASWSIRTLYTSTTWSGPGQIAVGEFYTGNPGAEVLAVSGGGSAYEARAIYGSGATWTTEKIMGTGGAAYGCAIGNLNRYRTGNEVAISGNTGKVWEAEEKVVSKDMAAYTIDNLPFLIKANDVVTVKATIKNYAQFSQAPGVPVKLSITGPGGYV
ncbi:MAG: VCBS repeat-containing protein [Candidatus Zixiibacteriota bacterium]